MTYRWIILFFAIAPAFVFAQKEDLDSLFLQDSTIKSVQYFETVEMPSNFDFQYRYYMKRAKKVYPLALHAAKVIDSLDREIEKRDKKRKQRKVARQTHRELKDDFKFLLRELYVSEGKVLTKLIYRETGMTVKEIIRTYKGKTQAAIFTGMAGMFDQNLEATYDPNNEDFVLECVINDLNDGVVEYDSTFETVDREHYRKDRKAYKKRVRENRREMRKKRRKERREKRRERREERRSDD